MGDVDCGDCDADCLLTGWDCAGVSGGGGNCDCRDCKCVCLEGIDCCGLECNPCDCSDGSCDCLKSCGCCGLECDSCGRTCDILGLCGWKDSDGTCSCCGGEPSTDNYGWFKIFCCYCCEILEVCHYCYLVGRW